MAAFDKNEHLSATRGILDGAFGISPSSILAQNVHTFDLLNPPPTLSSSSILLLIISISPDESIKIRECLFQLNTTAIDIAIILPTKGCAKVKLESSQHPHIFTRVVDAALLLRQLHIIARRGGSFYKTVIGMPEGANHFRPYGVGDKLFGRLIPPTKVRKRPPTPLPTPKGSLVFPMSVEGLPPSDNFERVDRDGTAKPSHPTPDKKQPSPAAQAGAQDEVLAYSEDNSAKTSTAPGTHDAAKPSRPTPEDKNPSPQRKESPHSSYDNAEKPSGIPIRPATLDRSDEKARLEAAGVSEAERDLRIKEQKLGLKKEQRAELERRTISTAMDAQGTMEKMARAEEKGGEAWTDEARAGAERRVTGS